MHFESLTVATMTWLTLTEYLCHKWPRIYSSFDNHIFLFTARRVIYVEQELLALPEFRVVHVVHIHGFTFLSSVLGCPPRFSRKNYVRFILTPISFIGGFMGYLCYLFLFTHPGVQHDFHIRRSSRPLTSTWWVSHAEQELPTLPEHLRSHLIFIGVFVAGSLVFCVVLCRSLFVLFPYSVGHCGVCPSICGVSPLVSWNFSFYSGKHKMHAYIEWNVALHCNFYNTCTWSRN